MATFINNLMDSVKINGTKALVSLGLIGMLGCATYARRDYNEYPAHKAEIALYNLREIAKNACDESSVTPEKLECKQEYCTSNQTYCAPQQVGQQTFCHQECVSRHVENISIDYDLVRKIVPGGNMVKICGVGCDEIKLKNERQAQDFLEALNIYLHER